MMRLSSWVTVGFATIAILFCDRVVVADSSPTTLQWAQFPNLPMPQGLAGSFVGVSGDVLVVAGGVQENAPSPTQNFSAKAEPAPTYSDEIFVLTSPQAAWKRIEQRMPKPVAYGSSISWKGNLYCFGGEGFQQRFNRVWKLHWNGEKIEISELAQLPQVFSHGCAAVLGDVVYLAGGLTHDGAPARLFWSFNLAAGADAQCQVLEPWPGPGRAGAVAAAQDEAFFVFGGWTQAAGDSSHGSHQDLLDGYRFDPLTGWSSIAKLPHAVTNDPTPGISVGQSHIFIVDADPSQDALSENETGKPIHDQTQQPILVYHTITDTWRSLESTPDDLSSKPAEKSVASMVFPHQTPVAWWGDQIVIAGGEVDTTSATNQVLSAGFVRHHPSLHALDFVMLAAYLAVLISMGVYFAKQAHGTHTYFLGDRNIPWWAAGISIFATSISALTFMAIPALVYRTDWVYFLGNLMIVAVAPVVIYFYIPFFRNVEITTAYEYLEKRFGLATRLTGSAAFLVYQLGRMGIVIYLPALALSSMTGINIYACILGMGLLATAYTTIGGIRAVIWIEVLQVMVLLGGAVLSLVIIVSKIPGGMNQLIAMGQSAGKFHAVNLTWDAATASLWVVVIGNWLKFLIPYTSDQSVVQRYLITVDERRAARSVWTNALLSIPAWSIFFALGTALWVFYKTHPVELDPSARNDEIFPSFIIRQLPPGCAGLLVVALLAAAMSSLESGMNAMSSVIVNDFYRRSQRHPDDVICMRVAKVVTLLLGCLSMGFASYIAMLDSTSVWNQFLKIMGLFGGGMGGLFLAGIFTRRTNNAGILVGFVASTVILFFVQKNDSIHFFLYGGIGMVSCFAIGWLASWLLPAEHRNLSGLTIFTRKSCKAPIDQTLLKVPKPGVSL